MGKTLLTVSIGLLATLLSLGYLADNAPCTEHYSIRTQRRSYTTGHIAHTDNNCISFITYSGKNKLVCGSYTITERTCDPSI